MGKLKIEEARRLARGEVRDHVFGADKGMRLNAQQRNAHAANGGKTRKGRHCLGHQGSNIVELFVPG
jgi:hypothetical protein